MNDCEIHPGKSALTNTSSGVSLRIAGAPPGSCWWCAVDGLKTDVTIDALVLRYLGVHPGASVMAMAFALRLGSNRVRPICKDLIDEGRMQVTGGGRKGVFLYWLVPA